MNYTLTHDAVGNMTDDGKDYKFVYDAFGRLKTVKNQSNTVVAEYTYNGLNMRIGWHYDADADADVDGSDPWYNFAMDDRWRIVATFRGSDTSPKELFAYHNAGANGRGGSSYIDSVILRNKDANTAWTSASDATLEERLYYVQNWRADVSAVLSDAGVVKEWVKYTSYGIPVRIDPGDYNRDGFVNGLDYDDFGDDFDNARSEADVNFDGVVNGDDYDLFSEWWDAPSTAGRFTLSASSVANRIGYAGYQYDPTFVGASRAIFHVRHRVYDAGLGRWTRRDPIGYKAGVNLYAYLKDQPLAGKDPMGLDKAICTSGCSSGGTPISGVSPPYHTDEGCENELTTCRMYDWTVRSLEAQVLARCGKTPSIGCDTDLGGGAYYDCSTNSISVSPRASNRCEALAHELSHALVMCGDCNVNRDKDGNTDCYQVACGEVRAYNSSGECCLKGSKRRDNETYCDCVNRKAIESTEVYGKKKDEPGPCYDIADWLVEDAMYDTNCFNPLHSPCMWEAQQCWYSR